MAYYRMRGGRGRKSADLQYDKPTWLKLMCARLPSLASHFESPYHKMVYKHLSQRYPKWEFAFCDILETITLIWHGIRDFMILAVSLI